MKKTAAITVRQEHPTDAELYERAKTRLTERWRKIGIPRVPTDKDMSAITGTHHTTISQVLSGQRRFTVKQRLLLWAHLDEPWVGEAINNLLYDDPDWPFDGN